MKKNEIFLLKNIEEEEIKEIEALHCMREQQYEKNEMVLHAGDMVNEIGIVLSGSVNLENVDLFGQKSILTNISEGEMFAEVYVLCQEVVMIDAMTAEQTQILFVRLKRLLEEENVKYSWYPKLLQNMLHISIQKNMTLTNRIFCTSPKTVRGRLITYLSRQALRNHNSEFTIPFNRQQMADYLNLDRSALSKELGKMRKEGMLEFHKNYFKLNQTQHFE